jgi:plastocyanin
VIDHTATSKAGKWDVTIPADKKARATMKTAGTFDYYCRFHPNMTARIAVVK